MAHLSESDIIKKYPIGTGLDTFRSSIGSACEKLGVRESSKAAQYLDDETLKNLALDLFLALQNLSIARHLPSPNRRGTLFGDLARFASVVDSDEFDVRSIIPILDEINNEDASDEDILNAVSKVITNSTPPPRQLPYPYQTPISFNTGSFVNTSENRKQFDGALKDELDSSLHIDVPGFFDKFFGDVADLVSIAEFVFKKCSEGKDSVYNRRDASWRDWPKDAKEEEVLQWFKMLIDTFLEFAKGTALIPIVGRRPLGQPNQPLLGSTTHRKLDVGFVDDTKKSNHGQYDWSQILVPGELKSNPNADRYSSTWLDLARYVREVLTAQDRRRFVLGFTLCGPIMRLWEFDRLGGIAASAFDINTEGLQFVSAILGFLFMNEEQLGFDPTIPEVDGKRYIEITRDGKPEKLVIDHLIKRHACVAGRATTCWKAYREEENSSQIFVVKDSWQYPEREEEGELLREATENGVVNVVRYFHHETVRVDDRDDDINGNVRRGLDIMKASNAFRIASMRTEGQMLPPNTSGVSIGSSQRSSSRSFPRKRSSSSLNEPLPSNKRTCSSSPHKQNMSLHKPNRVHRRVILRDYGKGIHKASSRVAMLAALEGNITGHESLRDLTGILQGDISIGNLMMNEEEDNPSWSSFLIDADLAIKETRENPSGAPHKTGTRAFMAIGALYGEKRTFMHDLESVFWVLFWICIHYTGPHGESRVVQNYERWNYADTEELAKIKKGEVTHEGDFRKVADRYFTEYYKPLIPWVNRLRKAVFPNGERWEREYPGLYSQMREILQQAMEDQKVKAHWAE